MTSRRPPGALSISSRSSSGTKQPQPQPQPPPAAAAAGAGAETGAGAGAGAAGAGQKPQYPQAAREDTPIVTRSSTPRSYLSTENVSSSSSSSTTASSDRNHDCAQNRQQQQQQQQQQQNDQQDQRDELSGCNGDDSDGAQRPWYKKAAEKYGSLELENKGSVARDHLALERTFLAWLRTSLAFASIGIAITQLFRLNTSISSDTSGSSSSSISQNYNPISPILPPRDTLSSSSAALIPRDGGNQRLRSLGKPLGATFIGIAIVVLLVGFLRYFESQYWVVRGKFPASRGSIAIVAGFTAALMIASLVVILAIAPGALEA